MSEPRTRSAVGERDFRVVSRQLGRTPHAMSRVVSRCRWGWPAVVECLPASAEGTPFPTLFYCTCPTLVAVIGERESAGGVAEWQARLAGSPSWRRSLAEAVAETRRRRAELVRQYGLRLVDGGASLGSGVGGVADPSRLKCLHAHVAHALASPGYRFGEEILSELARPWCTDCRCAAFAPPSGEEAYWAGSAPVVAP